MAGSDSNRTRLTRAMVAGTTSETRVARAPAVESARLMAAAPEGEIYATPAVVERSRTTFATTALAPFQVKGKAAPVAAPARRSCSSARACSSPTSVRRRTS